MSGQTPRDASEDREMSDFVTDKFASFSQQ